MRRSGLGLVFLAAAASALPAMAQDVRVLGRADVRGDGSFSVQWSGSGFEATFTGSKLFAQLDDWGDSIYRVEVDGLEGTLELEEGRKSYLLYDGEAGTHTIRVTRKTGSNSGPTLFSYIRADGKIVPTPERTRKMMVIGDSNATGYGVLGEDQYCGFSFDTQDHGNAFPAITANYFGADLHTVAVDGRGLIKNYGDDTAEPMKVLFDRTLPDSTRRWTPSRYKPDVIVVALGVGDFWDGDPGDDFDREYLRFLAELRQTYPEAEIFAAAEPQYAGKKHAAMVDSIRGAVETRHSRGDLKIEFAELALSTYGRQVGCDWHPGIDSQIEMSNVLADVISDKLGWDIGEAPTGQFVDRHAISVR